MIDISKLIQDAEQESKTLFDNIDATALCNQEKVLHAFQNNKIALRHFVPTTGYGYDDIGRDALCKLYADVFDAESAVVSPMIASGTHAITLALFGILRPNDMILSISGLPYDTLETVINGNNVGSLKDFNISFKKIDLIDGDFDIKSISEALKLNPKVVYLQRSRGYSWRKTFSIDEMRIIISFVKKALPSAIIMVDNCYGEFVDLIEPTKVGADVIMGSLIKNPGGGFASTGGYIAGKKHLVDLVSYRLTAPGVGMEIGSYNSSYREFYQGLFMAPHTTAQALKGSVLFGSIFHKLGYKTLPHYTDKCNDIIRSIKFNTKNELINFCQSIQKCSPVDSFAVPYPWDMPGYENQVIMAAGTFVQGSSIELSADSPIKEPYIAYLQGGLTYEHVKIAVRECVNHLQKIII